MNRIFTLFLSLSLSGSLTALILLLGSRLWKDRLSRQWQYYIWLIVIARLLLPFTPEKNLIGNVFQSVSRQTLPPNPISWPQAQSGLQHLPAPSPETAGLIWLGIALVLLIRKITVYQSFTRYVKAGQTLVSDIELLDRLTVLAAPASCCPVPIFQKKTFTIRFCTS